MPFPPVGSVTTIALESIGFNRFGIKTPVAVSSRTLVSYFK